MIALIGAVLLSLSAAYAQPAVRLNLYSSYTDNLFQSSQRDADWIELLYVDLDWGLRSNTELYYTGNTSLFRQHRELFNHAHTLGLTYGRAGRAGELHAGATLSARLDRRRYDYRDFAGGSAFVEAKRYLREDLLVRTGYTMRLQEYLNVSRQSYLEQSATARLTRFLPSRTTLDLRAELGVKSYLRRGEGEFFGAERGRHLLKGLAGVKVAQSLGGRTGLQFEYTRQHSFTGQGRFILGQLFDSEDELFNDRYSYQGQTLGLTLKHLGLGATQLELGSQLGRRNYIERLALDLDGFPISFDQTRRDRWHSLELELARPLQSARFSGLELNLHWSYRQTSSNDPYYDAAVNTYTAGLEYAF